MFWVGWKHPFFMDEATLGHVWWFDHFLAKLIKGMFGSMLNFPCLWFQRKYHRKEKKVVEKHWKTAALIIFHPKRLQNGKCFFRPSCNHVGPHFDQFSPILFPFYQTTVKLSFPFSTENGFFLSMEKEFS